VAKSCRLPKLGGIHYGEVPAGKDAYALERILPSNIRNESGTGMNRSTREVIGKPQREITEGR